VITPATHTCTVTPDDSAAPFTAVTKATGNRTPNSFRLISVVNNTTS